MQLKNPNFIVAASLGPARVVVPAQGKEASGGPVSDLSIIKKLPKSRMTVFRHAGIVLRCVGVALLVVALARPQRGASEEEVTTEVST